MKIKKGKIVEKSVLMPFVLIISLFALWGFANDITNPMVAALVQFAFCVLYGCYYIRTTLIYAICKNKY